MQLDIDPWTYTRSSRPACRRWPTSPSASSPCCATRRQRALGYAAAAGVLSSAVPFLAALVGLLFLGQSLGWAEWLAVATIVGANTVCVLTADHSPARVRLLRAALVGGRASVGLVWSLTASHEVAADPYPRYRQPGE
jgi:hypothetical protein